MTNEKMELTLRSAIEKTAPNDFAGVLSRCGAQKRSEENMRKRRKNLIPTLAAACVALCLVVGGLAYGNTQAVASVVSLDVNPSIELKVNKNEKVLECRGLNEDAAKVLFSMDGGKSLKNTDLNVAVNAIVGSLVQNGYLDSISSAILISVEDKDMERAARLQQDLTARVDGLLMEQQREAAVLSQTVTKDKELEKKAENSSISTGKAYLIERIIAKNNSLDFDKLSALTVEELKDLLDSGAPGMPIGKEEAARLAKASAGLTDADILAFEVDAEIEYDDDEKPHYEVDFMTKNGALEVKVDAYTGAILTTASGTPMKDPVGPAPANPATQDIGEAAAKAAAFQHAGVKESDVYALEVERETDDGVLEYEIDFKAGGMEYDYTVKAADGSILKAEKETADDVPQAQPQKPETADIGKAAAKAAALRHAGLAENEVTRLSVEKDYDDGRLEYEVDFRVGRTEYEYTIDGRTGSVLEHEKDLDD